jgi:hypothetical protein
MRARKRAQRKQEPVVDIEDSHTLITLPGRPMKSSRKARGSRGGFGTQSPRKVKLHYQATGAVSGVTAQFGSYEFQLDQFSGYADWVSVSDAYRLLKIRMKFIPKVNVQSLTTKAVTTTSQISYIILVKDYDDSTTPTSITELLEYNEPIIPSMFEPFEVELKPKVSGAVFAGGVTNGYAQLPSTTWLDAANDDIAHYGVKWGTGATGASQTTFQEWYVFVTGWFEFRQPR